MPSNGRRSGPAARRGKVSHRDAQQARDELAAGGLSHQDRRRLRATARAWELASRRRRLEFKHLVIAVLSGLAVMAVVAAALGFVPAIEAANGNGTAGTFVATSYSCGRRIGCRWLGTFQAGGGVVQTVIYEGSLPTGTEPGSRIPARYPGDGQAYALHGSHTWALDLIPMLLISSVFAFLVWLIAASRQRTTPAV